MDLDVSELPSLYHSLLVEDLFFRLLASWHGSIEQLFDGLVVAITTSAKEIFDCQVVVNRADTIYSLEKVLDRSSGPQ